jgi:hypothetical protein
MPFKGVDSGKSWAVQVSRREDGVRLLLEPGEKVREEKVILRTVPCRALT